MTNLEKLNADFAANASNILFTMRDDEVMGHRERGFYVKRIIDHGHECDNIIFDNGNHYLHDYEEQMLYVLDKIPQDYFVHKFIEKVISDFIDKWSIKKSDGNLYCSENEVKAEPLIRLLPYREEKVVYLTNIMIPKHLKHNRLGRFLIKEIFAVCQRLNYRLVLLHVVESFSRSLEKRNAKFLDFDTIEITNNTILK